MAAEDPLAYFALPEDDVPEDIGQTTAGEAGAARAARIALGSAAALGAMAAAVNWAARRAERANPPIGNFIQVDESACTISTLARAAGRSAAWQRQHASGSVYAPWRSARGPASGPRL